MSDEDRAGGRVRSNAITANSGRAAPAVTPDEQGMIDFALLWRQWGGGPAEEIFLKFGVVASEYFRRLELLLPRSGLDSGIADELMRICRLRRSAGGHHTLLGHEPRSPN